MDVLEGQVQEKGILVIGSVLFNDLLCLGSKQFLRGGFLRIHLEWCQNYSPPRSMFHWRHSRALPPGRSHRSSSTPCRARCGQSSPRSPPGSPRRTGSPSWWEGTHRCRTLGATWKKNSSQVPHCILLKIFYILLSNHVSLVAPLLKVLWEQSIPDREKMLFCICWANPAL